MSEINYPWKKYIMSRKIYARIRSVVDEYVWSRYNRSKKLYPLSESLQVTKEFHNVSDLNLSVY